MHKILHLLFFLPVLGFAQVEQGRLTAEKLCSPSFHGRGYVNGGDSIASSFIADEFEKMGCQFFKNTPFQPFQFKVNTFSNNMAVSVNGKVLVPGKEFVVDPSCPMFYKDSLRVFRITTDDLFKPKSLKNKISQASIGGSKAGVSFAFHFSLWKGDTLKKAQELAKSLGSSMPIIELTDTKFTWSVSQEQRQFALLQVQSSALDASLDEWVFKVKIDAKVVNHTARNVIAYVPAKKKSKNYFVFSAHYDHLGQMGQEAYFPGGNDNASGTALLLEMARYYVKNPSNVNIVFIAFAGEEVGLLGSKYYTENPVFPLKDIQFLFNLDIMGSGEEGATVVNATLFPEQFEVLKSINEKQQYLPKVASRGAAANSDHYFFTQKGVPAFFMYTMGPNKHYHDVYDTYEELSFNKFNGIYQLLIDFEKVICWKR
ncbi:M28 family metallopeptidase [Fluviicola taffensis]|uniref:Peptidase M28 n=1 Tax=Fluviicola taffensis (strain DSM 16823 / NCIMB 13979 / RW262) TaxID=755732 RepID=F2IAK6_FLUTR|nr:M20/M25/M40 family metallo-hydrolase [Fluviicola taffensis]AEA43142.1 peptidase M28 [Fluviicola taffensis DSM 16823]